MCQQARIRGLANSSPLRRSCRCFILTSRTGARCCACTAERATRWSRRWGPSSNVLTQRFCSLFKKKKHTGFVLFFLFSLLSLLNIQLVFMPLQTSDIFAGELRQERDRAAAVRQKEQAKPSYPEQTAGRNEETRHTKGETHSRANVFHVVSTLISHLPDKLAGTYLFIFYSCVSFSRRKPGRSPRWPSWSLPSRGASRSALSTSKSVWITDEPRHWNPVAVSHTHTKQTHPSPRSKGNSFTWTRQAALLPSPKFD